MASMPIQKIPPVSLALAVATALSLSACGESTSSTQGSQFAQGGNTPTPPPATKFNQNQLLTDVVNKVVVPSYQQFKQHTANQQNAINNYCTALQNTDGVNEREQAQNSWRQAMSSWQMIEVMQIGPLLDNSSDLRNKIYSWPNTSSCAVDQEVVLSEQNGYDITQRTSSRKGMDALEYLLFNTELQHTCTVVGTAPEGWDQRSDKAKRQARCAFSQKVAADLDNQAQILVNAWVGDNGYANVLINAGKPGNRFTDVHDAVNDVSDAMFYMDSSTKDAKLAVPLGIRANDCGTSPCVKNLESQYAQHSLANVLANIRGLYQLFIGGTDTSAVGFDDYLRDVGDADTAQKMLADLQKAIATADNLPGDLSQLLANKPEQAQQLHTDIKAVTDKMKTDFIQSLALELPATSAGDND